ncbi:uncharacterized protein LOC108045647 [Drosophila rhopaloa]|uniref:Uncharacterized protein n=1 Tax=Drosophila rhopaloa TaxID=1041015 RepID=A0ABM5HHQ1_DRORH|nr:uncharacterized protein LOC108045647 [Drosophila rhopaloa]
MFGLRVILASTIILFGIIHGECAAVKQSIELPSTDDVLKKSLIEAQSIGRIVNRINHKVIDQNTVPPASYIGDITRTSNVDQGYPCPPPSDIPQINSFQESKINENPSVAEFGSYIKTQSTHSTDFQLQIPSPQPTQHIHYHYIVPNTSPKPIINYVYHSDSNAYNVNSENQQYSSVVSQPSHINGNNLHYINQDKPQVNPLYSAVDNSGYLYDSPDEHQGQASENTSVYEALSEPGEVLKEQDPILKTNIPEVPQTQHVQAAVNPKKPEVYFIITTTRSPDSQKLNESVNEISDGSGLIDIRAGINEILDSQVEDAKPYNEHSAYNVPLN